MRGVLPTYFLLAVGFSVTALAVDKEIEKEFLINARVGRVIVKYQPAPGISYPGGGELVLFWSKSTTPFQSYRTFSVMNEPSIAVIDINGDGFDDFVFYNHYAGYGSPATRGGDVFLFVPALGKFARSVTLSGRGEIQRANTKGCTLVEYKSGPTGYTTEQWCFNVRTGRWKLVGKEGGEVTLE